jgi:hypothetical protein
MKKFCIILFVLFTLENIFSQSDKFYYSSEGPFEVLLSETNISINIGPFDTKTISNIKIVKSNYPYIVSEIGNIPFIDLNGDTFLLLRSKEVLFLFGKNEAISFMLTLKSGRYTEAFLLPVNIAASSYVVENNSSYLPGNICRLTLDKPWATNGNNSREWIQLEFFEKTNALFIANGFISYKNPHLYLQNSRIKKIKLTDDLNQICIFEIKDTPNPQVILLKNPTKMLRLDIIEVYNGTKYDDICVSWLNGISNINIFQ